MAFEGLLVVDDFSLFFNFLFAGVAAVIILASVDFLERNRFQAEYVALVLASTTGMMLMASTVDLIAIFVALELQAICFYVLVGIMKDARSSEAALKYLLLGAVSTALTLYGMAYLFGLSGSTNLNEIATFVDGCGLGDAIRARAGGGVPGGGPWVQDGGRAVPDVGAGRLPGRADAGDGVPLGGEQGGGFRGRDAHLRGRAWARG